MIDTQVDFLDGGASPIIGTPDRLPEMTRLVEAYRFAGRPIVQVIRLYDGADADIELNSDLLLPRATIFGASERDYRVVVAHDATSQVTPDRLADAVKLGACAMPTEVVARAVAASA